MKQSLLKIDEVHLKDGSFVRLVKIRNPWAQAGIKGPITARIFWVRSNGVLILEQRQNGTADGLMDQKNGIQYPIMKKKEFTIQTKTTVAFGCFFKDRLYSRPLRPFSVNDLK